MLTFRKYVTATILGLAQFDTDAVFAAYTERHKPHVIHRADRVAFKLAGMGLTA